MSLAGRNVLIAGGNASGMSIARVLLDAGARVVLQRGADEPDVIGAGTDSLDVVTDPLDTVEQAEGLAAKCWASFGPLAGLVIVPDESSFECFTESDDDWHTATQATLKIPFFLARAMAVRMEQAGGGCIVHVVGDASHATVDTLAVHEVTRSASLTMTLVLAKAFPRNVRVCTVVGSGNTPMGDAVSSPGADVARTVLFLLAEESLRSGVVVRLAAR